MANDDLAQSLENFYAAFDESAQKARMAVFKVAREHFFTVVEGSGLSEENKGQYLDGTDFKIHNTNTIVIEIKSSESALKAIESGSGPYSIKDKMLNNGKNVKTSKDGHRYKIVPIDKQYKTNKALKDSTQGEKDIQTEIKKVLQTIKPTLKASFSNKKTGEYHTVESFKDFGMLRTKSYQSKGAFENKRPARKTGYVLFRVMSDKPGTSGWVHPGFKGENLLGQLKDWLDKNSQELFDTVFRELMKDFT